MRHGSKQIAEASASGPDPQLGDSAVDEHAWRTLAEVSLERLALLHRIGRATKTSTTDDAEIDVVLDELEATAGHSGERPVVTTALARLDPLLAVARDRFQAMLARGGPFATIVDNARLTMPETEILAIAAACELDLRLARLLAFVQDETGPSRITLQTADRLLQDSEVGVAGALGLGSGLRRSQFIDITEEGPWALHTVAVHPGVMWALVGDDAVDPCLPLGTLVVADPGPSGAVPGGDHGESEPHSFVVISGHDRIRRRMEAARRGAADRFLVASQPTDLSAWRALVREATLAGSGVMIELEDDLAATLSPDGQRIIQQASHLAWAVTARRELPVEDMPDRPWVEFVADDHAATDAEWNLAVGPQAEHAHRLTPSQLDVVGRAYRARAGDLDAAVRRLVSGKLEQLAQRMRPTRGWDDIVLTPARTQQLRSIVDRYRYASVVYDRWGFVPQPSRGLVSLFSGPSGTGKTLAAEIIAGDLGLDVFKLDLSSVVSKYIGETEKNLEQIFEAAGGSNVVLFFDEADSLFGKRSEVKDARDRYANIEVSYLLQRLERYDGVVILATNFEKNIDEAFLRRIHTRVEFVVPAEDERLTIWKGNFPVNAPTDNIDIVFLARQFELSGGSIRNAAVHAAFLAASRESQITMSVVVLAIAREYRKLGRLLKPDQFGPWHELVTSLD